MNVLRQRYPNHACRLTTRGDSQNDSHSIYIHIHIYPYWIYRIYIYTEEKNKSARYLTDRRWRRFRTRDVFDVDDLGGELRGYTQRRNVCQTRRRPIDWKGWKGIDRSRRSGNLATAATPLSRSLSTPCRRPTKPTLASTGCAPIRDTTTDPARVSPPAKGFSSSRFPFHGEEDAPRLVKRRRTTHLNFFSS